MLVIFLVGGTGSTTSTVLDILQFNFSIPSNATIQGVVVESSRYASRADTISDTLISLVNRDRTIGVPGANFLWKTTYEVARYGSEVDGWNASLTPSVISLPTQFNVKIDCK